MTKDIDSAGHPHQLQHEVWFDFNEQPAIFSMPLDPVTLGPNADDDIAATLVGVIPQGSILVGAYGVASIASTGVSTGADAATWTVAIGGATAVEKEHVANTVADTPFAFDAVAISQVASGSAVEFSQVNGTNADSNSAISHVSLQLADANNWPAVGLSAVISDIGTAVIVDGATRNLAISPGAVDNDELYIKTTNETFKFAAGKVFIVEALLQFTEANTDDANIIFGVMNAVIADTLVDDGAGPRATGDYAAIWKVDGSNLWRAGVQSNGTQKPLLDVDSEVTAGGASYQRLWIKVTCESSTEAIAEFVVDNTTIGTIHFSYASATEMQLFWGVKNGGANAETLNVVMPGYATIR